MSGTGPVGDSSIRDMFNQNVSTVTKNAQDWIKGQFGDVGDLGDDPSQWEAKLAAKGKTLTPEQKEQLKQLVAVVQAAKASAQEGMQSLEAMKKLLEDGDIEGAVMLLQTTRAKGLEQQLGGRIGALQARNANIKALSDRMSDLQKHQFDKVDNKDPSDQVKADRAAAISTLKNQIDQLNSDSQLDMIGIQGLVNKRNEAFDMLSNLLGKFQKTIDGIVGNMR
jgi:hypothetical protein